MTRSLFACGAACVLLATAFQVGCGTSQAIEDARILSQRQRLLLTEEPSGAIAVSQAKQAIGEDDEIVLMGRIGAPGHSPWDPGKASFLIADAAALIDVATDGQGHHHGEGHDAANCPFCNRNKSITDSLAIVHFHGADGEILEVDARDLLGVQEKQLVVVRGRGHVDRLGNLTIAADGIYIRR